MEMGREQMNKVMNRQFIGIRPYRILAVFCAVLAAPIIPALSQTTPATSAQPTAATEPARKIGETVNLPSGLQYKFTQLGAGPAPKVGDVMIIHGIGSYTNGTEFWNTRTENAPYEYTFGVDRVIKGFEEGMHFVREGDRIIITMKPELAYGARGNGQIPPNSTLVFDYEILSIKSLTVARLVQEASAAGKLDEELARVQKSPEFKDYYASPAGLVSLANRANRTHPGDGEKILKFGMALLPDAYQIPQALARLQAQNTNAVEAVANYQTALKLNKQDSDAAKRDFNRATEAVKTLQTPK
jgi:FKBP-type peptidyl-prolyl cis-trans isomerase